MKHNDDIPTTDTNEIKQLIDRVKQGKLGQGDAQLIEKLLNILHFGFEEKQIDEMMSSRAFGDLSYGCHHSGPS